MKVKKLSNAVSRLPPGRRGLKRRLCSYNRALSWSPSPRKAWIETYGQQPIHNATHCRLPPGRRGLKLKLTLKLHLSKFSRLPPGRRGLKQPVVETGATDRMSPSPRKAWIETRQTSAGIRRLCCRLPPGRRGLKPFQSVGSVRDTSSPSPRKAWIETYES